MASIREELVLVDKFTSGFTNFIKLSKNSATSMKDLRQAAQRASAMSRVQVSAMNAAAATARAQAAALRLQHEQQKKSASSASSLTSELKRLVGAYVGFQGIRSLFSLSDQMSTTTAKLDMMNDGLQTTAELNKMIFDSAQRSRGAYQDTADMVAKLGNLAGEAFGSTAEIVDFAEQINKQMTLSGASNTAKDAAMLQLTQAMSSGVLRGEELNSILEQTPTIAKTIAEYLGVTTGEMRELASEGAITAEVVKNAMFAAADETNAKFAEMPMTWEQVWTQFKNIGTMAIQPVLDGINWLANNIDTAIEWIKNNFDIVASALAGLGAAAVIVGAMMIGSAISTAAAWVAANWPILLVVAAVSALIYIALQAGATFEEIGGVIGGALGFLYAYAMNNCIVPLQNGFASIANFIANVFNDPVTAIKVLFFDMVITVLGYLGKLASSIENLLNKIPGVEVNLTSGIEKMTNSVNAARENAIASGNYKEYVEKWDYVGYEDAFNKGAEIGSNIGSKIDDFDISAFAESMTGGVGSIGSDWQSNLDDIAQSSASTAGSAGNIEKSIDATQEDIKSLVDVAERRYVNQINLTAQTPVINVTGQNTGRTAADRQNLANAIRDVLLEQMSSGSSRSTAVAHR